MGVQLCLARVVRCTRHRSCQKRKPGAAILPSVLKPLRMRAWHMLPYGKKDRPIYTRESSHRRLTLPRSKGQHGLIPFDFPGFVLWRRVLSAGYAAGRRFTSGCWRRSAGL